LPIKFYHRALTLCILVLFIGSSFTSAFLIDAREKKYDKIITLGNNFTFQNNNSFNHCNYRSISYQNLSYFKNENPASLSHFLKNRFGELSIEIANIGNSIKKTIDNGFIMCGYAGNKACIKGFLIKTDSQGYEVWNKTYFIKQDTRFISLEHGSDGGYIVSGSTYDGLNNTYNIVLMKTDNQGNKLWLKTYDEQDQIIDIKVRKTNDGGYIIADDISDPPFDSIFLIKTDIYGEKIWNKTIEFNHDILWNDIQQTSDGGYIISGTLFKFEDGLMFAFLLKTDEYGNEIWYETYSYMNSTVLYSIIQTEDNGFMGVGQTGSSFSQNASMMIIKTDESGDEEWIKTYDLGACYCIKQTSNNDFIIGGWDYNPEENYAILLKIDEYGNKMWCKVYDDNEEAYGYDVEITENGDYALTGVSLCSSNPNMTYVLLLKTDDVGNEQFCRYFNVAEKNACYVKFYGWDISSSCYKFSIEISHFRWGYGGSTPIEYYETKYFGLCPGSYYYMVSWQGKEGECSVDGIFEINAGEYLDIRQNLTFCDDLPNLSIDKPKNALYINNKHIISFFTPIIIGNLNVVATASDFLSGIYYVEFYIDDTLMLEDYTKPYSYNWNRFSFGKHRLKLIAFDKVGYEKSEEIIVWKFF
jgi:hypothetical protein